MKKLTEEDIKSTVLTVIKSTTIGEEKAKQVIRLLQSPNLEDVISVTKYILCESDESFEGLCHLGFAKGRIFKDKILMQQRFSIKVSSLNILNDSLLNFYNKI